MIPLRYRDNPGEGKVIQALLPVGFKVNHTDLERKEEVWWTVWAERWVQFPTDDWKELQSQIGRMLEKAIDFYQCHH